MKKSSYYEQLKDPRWQRKRLEILEAAGFCCQMCGDSKSTLHVHHLIYVKGKSPWEYEDGALVSLCEGCHETWHHLKFAMDIMVAGLDLESMLRVAGYAFAVSGGCSRMAKKGAQSFPISKNDADWPDTAPGECMRGILDAIGNGVVNCIEGEFVLKNLVADLSKKQEGAESKA